MVTPVSAAGATARALAPFEVVAGETEGLLVLTDFPDCFSTLLGFAVAFAAADCFDATTGFFVADGAGLAGAALADGLAAGLAGLAAALLAGFFAAAIGRLVLVADFGGALRALLAPARATVLLRAGAFAFFARLTGAGLFFAIACVHLEARRPRVIA
jgi:hypothetical protein